MFSKASGLHAQYFDIQNQPCPGKLLDPVCIRNEMAHVFLLS